MTRLFHTFTSLLPGRAGTLRRLASLLMVTVVVSLFAGYQGSHVARAASAPQISDVNPTSRSNTIYDDQPLSARIIDSSPILKVTFTLRDLTSGLRTILPSTAMAANNEYLTAPASFAPGHLYSIRIVAEDIAGSTAVFDQGTDPSNGFLRTTATVASDSVLINAVTAPVSLGATGIPLASFQHIRADIGAVRVLMGGTQHAGFGYADIAIPLGDLQLCDTHDASSCELLSQVVTAASTPLSRSAYMQFSTLTTRTSLPLLMQAGPLDTVDLGELSAQVPVSWSGATLEATRLSVTPSFPVCSSTEDPAYFSGCDADPLRFFDDDASSVAAKSELDHIMAAMYTKNPYATGAAQAQSARIAVIPSSSDAAQACASITYTIAVASNGPVFLAAAGGPPGAVAVITPNSLLASGVATMVEHIPCGIADGTYSGSITAAACPTMDCSTDDVVPFTAIVGDGGAAAPPTVAIAIAPPIGLATPCSTVTYTIAVATSIATSLVNSGGPPGATTSFFPPSFNSSGVGQMSQTLSCTPSPILLNNGQPEATGGPWAGSVTASACPASSCASQQGNYFTNEQEGAPIVGGVSTAAFLDVLWLNANPVVPGVGCVEAILTCNHMVPFAVGAETPPAVEVSPLGNGAPYPAFAPAQYVSLCAIGLCASPDTSPMGTAAQPPGDCANDGYCPWGKMIIQTDTLDEAPCVTTTDGTVSCTDGYYCGASPQPPGTCGGPHTHRWFGAGGVYFSCGASSNGGPNCGDHRFGWPDSDGSQDGAAVSWGGNWAIDYQSAQADYYWPNGNCHEFDGWSLTEGVNSPTVQQNGTFPPAPHWQGEDYVGWQDTNGGTTSACNGWSQLFGWGAGGDMYEGHYGSTCVDSQGQVENCPNNGTINGAYTHASQQTTWQWSFSCGVPKSCAIGVSPSDSSTVMEQDATPSNYDY